MAPFRFIRRAVVYVENSVVRNLRIEQQVEYWNMQV